MFLPRNMLLLFNCELNHHVDLITVYGGHGRGFKSVLYLFPFLHSKKQPPAHNAGIQYIQKNNLKWFNTVSFLNAGMHYPLTLLLV